MKEVVGVLIFCPSTKRVLLVRRSSESDSPKTWALISGGIEENETPLRSIKREILEELQYDPNKIFYRFISIESEYNHFYFFQGLVDEEFTPILNDENEEYGWFDKDSLPHPLYPKLIDKISEIWNITK